MNLEETLIAHGRRHLNLNSKWIEGCTTGKEITELVSIDEIDALRNGKLSRLYVKGIPRPWRKQLVWQITFWYTSNGFMRLLPREISLPNENSTEWTADLVIQENRCQVPSKWMKIRHHHCRMYKNLDGGHTRV